MLTLHDVARSYQRGTIQALRGITLSCEHGVLGLLGPNGAGKSTLLRILATLDTPTGGHVRWEGKDVHQEPERVRAVLGYLPQDFGAYPNLSPVEFLELIAAVKGLNARSARARVQELLVAVNLTSSRDRPIGGFSGGMRQRVGIAQALLNDPRLLILDEPTAGLDPEERVRFRSMLSELAHDRVVIISTHVVSDIEFMADAIAIMSNGRLLAHGSRDQVCAMARPHAHAAGSIADTVAFSLEEAYLALCQSSAVVRAA